MGDCLPQRAVYSPRDVSELCRVSPDEVFHWARDGRLSYFEVPGGHWRFRQASLEKFLAENQLNVSNAGRNFPEKFRVLVVEDDIDLLEITVDLLLDNLPIEVQQETNGFDAALTIANWHPDLIILDFVMPGMTGFELCKRIRANPQTSDIPVLAVTSLSLPNNRKAVMDSGVSDFLGKPFYSQDLLDRVRLLLGIQSAKE